MKRIYHLSILARNGDRITGDYRNRRHAINVAKTVIYFNGVVDGTISYNDCAHEAPIVIWRMKDGVRVSP